MAIDKTMAAIYHYQKECGWGGVAEAKERAGLHAATWPEIQVLDGATPVAWVEEAVIEPLKFDVGVLEPELIEGPLGLMLHNPKYSPPKPNEYHKTVVSLSFWPVLIPSFKNPTIHWIRGQYSPVNHVFYYQPPAKGPPQDPAVVRMAAQMAFTAWKIKEGM